VLPRVTTEELTVGVDSALGGATSEGTATKKPTQSVRSRVSAG
jgi:hypothetical protein